MLDEGLIEKNFKKSLSTYNENASVQKKMAEFLVSKLKSKKYKKILEIGSYTGLLTSLIIQNIEFENYFAVDIVDSFDFIKNLSPKIHFKKTKIEDFNTEEKFDLIISSASLQWVDDFEGVILKLKSMLNTNGTIALSLFGKQNLVEIKTSFNSGLNYFLIEKIKEILPNSMIYSSFEKLKFNSAIEILKHFKNTGVNSIQKNKLNYKQIKDGLKILDEKFNNTITYNPIYIIYQCH